MNGVIFDANKHIPVTAELPDEEVGEMKEREFIPPPSPWARTAVVKHRHTREQAVVHRVDFVTRQLRLWYPARAKAGLPLDDQFDSRTGWQSFEMWEPEIMFSPDEIERQEASKLFDDEIAAFDADGLSLVLVFCDDPDPRKRLAKVRALKKTNLVQLKAAVDGTGAGLAAAMPAEPTPAPTKKGK